MGTRHTAQLVRRAARAPGCVCFIGTVRHVKQAAGRTQTSCGVVGIGPSKWRPEVQRGDQCGALRPEERYPAECLLPG